MTIVNMAGGGDSGGVLNETVNCEPIIYTSTSVSYRPSSGSMASSFTAVTTNGLVMKGISNSYGFAIDATGTGTKDYETASSRATVSNSLIQNKASSAMSALTTLTDVNLLNALSKVCEDGDTMEAEFYTLVTLTDSGDNIYGLYSGNTGLKTNNPLCTATLTYHPDGVIVGSKNLTMSLSTDSSTDIANFRGNTSIEGNVYLRFNTFIVSINGLHFRS